MRSLTLSATAATIGLLLAGAAAPGADINRGRIIADRWCVTCHAVEPQQRPVPGVPTFEVIARNEDLDAARLAYFLMDPHPKMPNMGLTRSEAADLAAYI